MIGICGTSGCISATAVAAIFAALMGCWAIGFGVGKSVAWVRAIKGAA